MWVPRWHMQSTNANSGGHTWKCLGKMARMVTIGTLLYFDSVLFCFYTYGHFTRYVVEPLRRYRFSLAVDDENIFILPWRAVIVKEAELWMHEQPLLHLWYRLHLPFCTVLPDWICSSIVPEPQNYGIWKKIIIHNTDILSRQTFDLQDEHVCTLKLIDILNISLCPSLLRTHLCYLLK